MKVLLMTDMEGVAGVKNSEDWCMPDSRFYSVGCRLLTLEVNAAVEGFFAGGATYVQVADGHGAGGILVCRKVAALAEAFGLKCALHGTMGLQLAGWLQCSASFGAEWQELALVTPPLLPEELWAPGLRVIKQGNFIRFENGEAVLPDVPGIGLDVDEDALAEYRVK